MCELCCGILVHYAKTQTHFFTMSSLRRRFRGGADVLDPATVQQITDIQESLKKLKDAASKKEEFEGTGKSDDQPFVVSLQCPAGWGAASVDQVDAAAAAGKLAVPKHTPTLFKYEQEIDEDGNKKGKVVFCLPQGRALQTAQAFTAEQFQDVVLEMARLQQVNPDAKISVDMTCSRATDEDSCKATKDAKNENCVWSMDMCRPSGFSKKDLVDKLLNPAPASAPAAAVAPSTP